MDSFGQRTVAERILYDKPNKFDKTSVKEVTYYMYIYLKTTQNVFWGTESELISYFTHNLVLSLSADIVFLFLVVITSLFYTD